jgi:MFS family permease
MFFLPSTPSDAKFLTEEELSVAIARLKADNPTHGPLRPGITDPEHFSWLWIRRALTSPNTLFCCLANFCVAAPLYSFALFLPTIVHGLGYKALQAQLLTVPPNVLGFIMCLVSGYLSDKYRMRGPLLIAWTSIACIGYAIQLGSPNPMVRYFGTFFVAFVFCNGPLALSWLSNNLSPHYVRATGIALEIMTANCAGFIATFSYLEKDR